ncbi:MAG: hypothetical protein DF280_02385 ['Brassica napus' phytoplasma]|nr:MAG: hypothetical protein DF280_02385 ['Brassica napus' phytoplasma]
MFKDGKTIDWIDEYDKNGKIVKKPYTISTVQLIPSPNSH